MDDIQSILNSRNGYLFGDGADLDHIEQVANDKRTEILQQSAENINIDVVKMLKQVLEVLVSLALTKHDADNLFAPCRELLSLCLNENFFEVDTCLCLAIGVTMTFSIFKNNLEYVSMLENRLDKLIDVNTLAEHDKELITFPLSIAESIETGNYSLFFALTPKVNCFVWLLDLISSTIRFRQAECIEISTNEVTVDEAKLFLNLTSDEELFEFVEKMNVAHFNRSLNERSNSLVSSKGISYQYSSLMKALPGENSVTKFFRNSGDLTVGYKSNDNSILWVVNKQQRLIKFDKVSYKTNAMIEMLRS